MLILKPEVHETIWGGNKLTKISGTDCYKIGHLYSVNCNKSESNFILNGNYKGKTFNNFFDDNKEKYGLQIYEFFPLIIALVDASENLSIQVHPDDMVAPVLNPEIKYGKNESWFFIDAPESGYIYNGCKCNDMEELKKAISEKRMGDFTDRLKVEKGDYTYIKAGTLHALSKGSLVYEIEENAGTTYRFYDFERVDINGKKRELQIPEAFFSIKLNNKSVTQKYGCGSIDEKKYKTEYFKKLCSYKNMSSTLQVVTLLSGKCELEHIAVIPGMSIILFPEEEVQLNESEVMIAQPNPF